MIKTLKEELKYLMSLRDNDLLGDCNGTLSSEIKHLNNIIELYEKA